MAAPVTFRDMLRRLSPTWLQRGVAEKILYGAGVLLDGCADAVIAAVAMRFPGLYSGQSLRLIGNERRIRRGLSEPDETYAGRLIPWLDQHRGRGGPYELLEQLRGFYAAAPFPIDLVYYTGQRFRLATDGTITRDAITWSPDPDSERWARWWLLFHWPTPIVSDGLWSDPGTWDDGGVWDSSTFLPEDIASIKLVPADWIAGHALGTIVIQPDDAELWDYPVGTWGDPGIWDGTSTPLQIGIE